MAMYEGVLDSTAWGANEGANRAIRINGTLKVCFAIMSVSKRLSVFFARNWVTKATKCAYMRGEGKKTNLLAAIEALFVGGLFHQLADRLEVLLFLRSRRSHGRGERSGLCAC